MTNSFPRGTWLVACATLVGMTAQSPEPKARWWMDEPIRLVQTNLRESDAGLDARRLIAQVGDLHANALLFNMGGIVAFYPTKVAYHYPSTFLPPGRDLFGDVLSEARKRSIRVIGRFDLSKTQKPVYDAHPEWFFRSASGNPAIYNGLYSTCINGGYYRAHAIEILTEALEKYEVDGLFFNMFGNPSHDYSGNPLGPCHCDACRQKFQARFGRPLAKEGDAEYGRFMRDCSHEVAEKLAGLIHRKRPNAAFLTYIQAYTDGIMSESNTSVTRPLPLWPYSASDNINRALGSEPDKMAFNLCMSFIDFPWRFATVPPAEIRLRLYQNMAHGAGPAFTMASIPDQEDRTALLAAKPVLAWHADHEDLYLRQTNAGRVLLLGAGGGAYRGLFKLLSEQHIPFTVSDNLNWLESRPGSFDLVLAPAGVPARLEDWVRGGGAVLATGTQAPAFGFARNGKLSAKTQGYWRIRDHSLFPSLRDTNLLFFDGEYLEMPGYEGGALTLIPPAMFGPPEKVWADKRESQVAGLIKQSHGRGTIIYVPWDVGSLYYRHGSQAHGWFVADLIDHLLKGKRQLRTNAHPLVEVTLMRQAGAGQRRERTLVHFVNLSGHSGTTYFEPIEMRDVRVEVAGNFKAARSVKQSRALELERGSGTVGFTLERLADYDVVVLEE